ncbi:MAG: PAS domain S-box protein, partial [Verrucomicrobiota bacterium]
GMALHELVCDAAGQPVDYVLLDMNPAFETLTGLRRAAVLGHRASEVYGGEVPMLEVYAEVATTGRPATFETTYEPLQKTFAISVFSPAKGRFATVFADITEHKRAAAELAASEKRHRAIIDASPVPLAVNDGQQHITYLNRAFGSVFGYTLADIPTLADWWPKAYPDPQYRKIITDAWKARLEQAKRTGKPFEPLEAEIRCKDGTRRTILACMAPLSEGDNEGEHLAVLYDITERKQAEESHARLAMAVEQAAETIVITDASGTIIYANPAFEKTSGYSRAEVRGQNPRVLKSGQQDATFYRQLWETIQHGEVWSGHFVNKRKDGGLYDEEATISPIRDAHGRIINFVAVKRDVTREMQLEEQVHQSQKMEAIGALAGGIAHDFNNVLAVIFGYASLLKEDLENGPAGLADVDEILLAATRAKELVQQIMIFSRKRELSRQIIRLDTIVKEATKFLRASLPAEIAFEIQLAADAPAVLANATQIYQVTVNLATNALHAMEGRPGQLTVRLESFRPDDTFIRQHPQLKPMQYARLTVADTGH